MKKELTKEAYEIIVHRRKPLDVEVKGFPACDVGCGSGQNCSRLKGFVVCLDIAERQLLEARKRGCEYLIQADMEYMPFRDDAFLTLMYIASLHHLPDPSKALKEAERTLKKGGRVIATVWLVQPKFLFRRNALVRSRVNGRVVYRFYHFFLPWELCSIFREEGFFVEECRNYRVKSLLPNNTLCVATKK
ncbi:MAG: type 11 methyltransferase [Candidatus Aramenus sulfurataquae]|uniref:Type 11 methyltransferase n=1 Tax=Candidatus Aramenus sulfurataquae TaxID=1326980 RepID=W7KVB2_9CREN|nr:MAG: type 11 methyltransferase [Candidatus Aramenus sulfurataquae]